MQVTSFTVNGPVPATAFDSRIGVIAEIKRPPHGRSFFAPKLRIGLTTPYLTVSYGNGKDRLLTSLSAE